MGVGKIKLKDKFDEIKYFITKNNNNVRLNSNLNIENVNLKKHKFLKDYFPHINDKINLRNQKLIINYENKNLSLSGSGEVKVDKEYDKIKYALSKKDEKFNFDVDLKFDKTKFKIPQLNYIKKNFSVKGSGKIQLEKKFDKIEYLLSRNGDDFNFFSNLNIESVNFNKHKFLDNFFPQIKKKINFKN